MPLSLDYDDGGNVLQATSAYMEFRDRTVLHTEDLTVRFGTQPIGRYFRLLSNNNSGENNHTDYAMHVFLREYQPDVHLYDTPFIWRFATNWYTPSWRWEWVFWRELPLDRAALPVGYDLMHCDRLDFSKKGSTGDFAGRMVLENVTLGAYLTTSSPSTPRRIYRPCGDSTFPCRIINNQAYCGGQLPTRQQVAPFFPIIPIVVWLASTLCVLRRRNKRQQRTRLVHDDDDDDDDAAELAMVTRQRYQDAPVTVS